VVPGTSKKERNGGISANAKMKEEYCWVRTYMRVATTMSRGPSEVIMRWFFGISQDKREEGARKHQRGEKGIKPARPQRENARRAVRAMPGDFPPQTNRRRSASEPDRREGGKGKENQSKPSIHKRQEPRYLIPGKREDSTKKKVDGRGHGLKPRTMQRGAGTITPARGNKSPTGERKG